MNKETIDIIFGFISIHLLVVVSLVGYFLIYRVFKRADDKKHSLVRRLVSGILLPISFTTIFLNKRSEKSLPLYFRLFLKFTRFCSKIPYFHFLPKFLVATLSEFLIHVITGQELLTGLLFLWSMSFFLLVSLVESRFGELEEESITLANKIFLYSVSLLTIIVVIIGNFFWEAVRPFFENGFWRFIASIANFFNQMLIDGISAALHHPWMIAVGLVLLLIYVSSSLFLSEYLRRKK